jgi:transposase
VIDILKSRDSADVEAWLKEHPGIEVITRDRASAYANAASGGAPQAKQVADRWHLLKNLREPPNACSIGDVRPFRST